MSRRVEFSSDEYYHVYNRGTEKRRIFMTKSDYERFLLLLYVANQTRPIYIKFRGRTSEQFAKSRSSPSLVDIGAYCLMPNHFHLILREKEDAGISKFMQKILTAYTMYFNKRHDRSGALFQGKFKANHVDTDRYLNYLVSYVHLNPVSLIEPTWKETGIRDKREAEKYLDTYRYSSYLDYSGKPRPESTIVSKSSLPLHSDTPIDFKEQIREWLSYQ